MATRGTVKIFVPAQITTFIPIYWGRDHKASVYDEGILSVPTTTRPTDSNRMVSYQPTRLIPIRAMLYSIGS